jgi:Transglycosylase SLT domain
MAVQRRRKRAPANLRGNPQRRFRAAKFLPAPAVWRRWLRAFQRAPLGAQLVVALLAAMTLSVSINWIYQVVRKPSELFFPVSGTLYKTPAQTWAEYEPIFRKHSTAAMTPEFLAALAQVEGSGNPIVRTYWRFSWQPRPFEVYRPASSAVGMYQITNSTFEEAKQFCIHDHKVVEDGPWDDWRSCWFNGLYTRVVPSHAVEMTSAYLDRKVSLTLARHRIRAATIKQKQNLATVIHLCGAGAGNAYARRGMRLLPGQRCGTHDVRTYLARVSSLKMVFTRLAREK